MAAGIYNFNIEQGTTFRALLTLKYADGTPIDLTGYSLRGQIRETADSQDKVADFECTIDDETLGEISIALSPEQSTTFRSNGKAYSSTVKYVYDIEMYQNLSEGLEKVYRILNGFVYMSPEVTK